MTTSRGEACEGLFFKKLSQFIRVDAYRFRNSEEEGKPVKEVGRTGQRDRRKVEEQERQVSRREWSLCHACSRGTRTSRDGRVETLGSSPRSGQLGTLQMLWAFMPRPEQTPAAL